MDHKNISKCFEDYLNSFLYIDEIDDLDIKNNEISKSIYKHIFRIKAAQWKYKIMFNRRKSSAISDIFQDIVALYLKNALGCEYDVIIEERIGDLQADILIKYQNKNIFIIEVKTTIGWERDMHLNGKMKERIDNLSKAANIPKNNIVYILMTPWNVNREFSSVYWDEEKNQPKELSNKYPFNKIRPLLTAEDPCYWESNKHFRKERFEEYSDETIEEYSEKGIVIPLEVTINEIKEYVKNNLR